MKIKTLKPFIVRDTNDVFHELMPGDHQVENGKIVGTDLLFDEKLIPEFKRDGKIEKGEDD